MSATPPSDASAATSASPPIRFARPHRIAFIQSARHPELVAACRAAFIGEVVANGLAATSVSVFEVPGAYEIPLHAQLLAKTGRFTAIVAAALVVDSPVFRHAFIASTVVNALMQVQLQTEIPIFSAVLTPEQFHDQASQFDYFREHFGQRGIDVAQACLRTLSSLDYLGNQVVAGME
ncbi:6,7-dimethyl-8-ribityllumazine synthase [Bradyrhizobium sp. WD16]|uniref:6,7-dimethyl-8-ribityllumazine synthase n=1 Tax=Bradyrhizobium sp. WD16 TaxID=1521768 RepID=UPI0020A4824E|nr:6,7-dimethyl-8-ribityllumazine synthase [Bradyrhizobium sp. WD16]UTD27717.1 6,7-dimethyl-8-ribityllumazine synthase [Bradyrhizobium sp. WD16]